MHLPAVGERAAQLPWLWPDAHSLTALSQPLSPATWPTLRRDPGALLLVLRHLSLFADSSALVPERLLEPRILETVSNWIRNDRGSWIDWRRPSNLPVYETALAIAHHAHLLSQIARGCDPNAAWTAGLLVPLGWFAVTAIDPGAVSECRSDPAFETDPSGIQQNRWGLDHSAIVRRLAHRWLLPDWLSAVVGHLDFSWQTVQPLGVDSSLLATVQMAVVMAERAGYSLGLSHGIDEREAIDRLRIEPKKILLAERRFQSIDFAEAFEPEWHDPRLLPELPMALQASVDRRRADSTPFLAPLERDLDRLHEYLRQTRHGEEDRVRNEKLAALAEFAAGASHEINNPLAVISGQSQYLLHRDPDERERQALQSIVRQTQRIHAILAELMQFARPPLVKQQHVSLSEILAASVDSHRASAKEAGVKLDCIVPELPVWIDGDPKQLQTAIGCLVRNAIEASAATKGWVRIGIRAALDRVDVLVEDSGSGLTAVEREHMFDPFFSGRSAGRGRGLGLPTAWRLAKQHGGDVRYEGLQGGCTRFVLSLPLPNPVSERMIA